MKKWMLTILMLLMTVLISAPAYAADTARMNLSSVTLVEGETLQLKTLVNDKVKKASSWSSEKPYIASVSSSGKVTAKRRGSSYIRADVSGKTLECLVSVVTKTDTDAVRYSVLILDTSKSMKGSPLTYAKAAAKSFVKTVLSADGRNYVAIVTLSSKPTVVCTFTDRRTVINKKISALKASGNTGMEAALSKAKALLSQVPGGKHVTKNVVLLSDGLPNTGKKRSSGHYNKSLHKDYKYANAAYVTDKALKKNAFVYALGFFHKISKKDLKFGKRLMKDLASKDKYYVVTDQNEIKEVIEDIADIITTVIISESSVTLEVGETKQLELRANNQLKTGTWKSGNTSIATVSSDGLVKGIKAGKTVVSGTYRGEKRTCTVTVKNPRRTVSFDACGGEASSESKIVTYTKQYGTLPSASQKGFTFTGWYTEKNGGVKIESSSYVTINKDHTLYAHWKMKPHRYKVVDTGGYTREEAKALCEAAGGYLASINSKEEQELIKTLIADPKKRCYWLGGSKAQAGAKWYWDDGSAFSYTAWDGSADEGGGNEPYMAIVGIPRPGTGKAFGEWMDLYNEGYGTEYTGFYIPEEFGYICEWDE